MRPFTILLLLAAVVYAGEEGAENKHKKELCPGEKEKMESKELVSRGGK